MIRFSTIVLSTALVLAATTAEATTTPAVTTSETTSNFGNLPNQALGFDFQPNQDLLVTHLGIWDDNDDGFPTAEVGVFRVADQALLTPPGLVVQGTDLLQDHFRYVALGTPLSLTQ